MKRILIALLCLAVAVSAAGCSSSSTNSNAGAGESEQNVAEEVPEPEEEERPPLPGGGMVADAAMYRGVVTAVENQDDRLLLTLEQVEGTDFGAPALSVLVEGVTNESLTLEDIGTGSYMQVYYGGPVDETVTAITATVLPEAELSIYNGTLLELEKGEEQHFLLQSLDGEDTILFYYDEGTQFYLDFDALEKGDRLNIYFSGITTRSIPPQATALEVRPWHGAE